MSAPELLPCPFCGGRVEIDRGRAAGAIQCIGNSSCLFAGLLIGFDLTQEATAIAAWNRRATPEALAAAPEVQALIEAARREGRREALLAERQNWWQPEYPGQERPTLVAWFTDESEAGLSGFDTKHDRDAFHLGGNGPFVRRVTGNEYPQLPIRALKKGE